MAKQLRAHVHVEDSNGRMHVFGPDSKSIPGWARQVITNPSAWEGDEAPAAPPEPTGNGGQAPETLAADASVKDVLAYVGEDVDRAREALAAEQAKESPRKGVVEPLQELISKSEG